MRILITWGSKRGGTEGIARMLGEALRGHELDVELRPADQVGRLDDFDAVIVGGALYANRWHAAARRFVTGHVEALRHLPVWFFSSGPLDDSADRVDLAPPRQVEVLMERVGARGHHTFGGRLARDAKGFPAAAMAKKVSGDWRNPAQIRAWADEIVVALPTARPRTVVDHPARSGSRLAGHAILGWTICAVTGFALGSVLPASTTRALVAIVAPVVFLAISLHYFLARGARDALPTAIAFTVIYAVLGVGAGLVQGETAILADLARAWLPLAEIFVVTWLVGAVCATLPWPKLPKPNQDRSTLASATR